MNQVVIEFIEQWLERNEPPELKQVVQSDRTPSPTPDNGEAIPTNPPKQGQRQTAKRGKGKEG